MLYIATILERFLNSSKILILLNLEISSSVQGIIFIRYCGFVYFFSSESMQCKLEYCSVD